MPAGLPPAQPQDSSGGWPAQLRPPGLSLGSHILGDFLSISTHVLPPVSLASVSLSVLHPRMNEAEACQFLLSYSRTLTLGLGRITRLRIIGVNLQLFPLVARMHDK